ncbi:hypothetical protein NMG60_11014045 [Bertholletia excelsa]
MFVPALIMSNSTTCNLSQEATVSSGPNTRVHSFGGLNPVQNISSPQQQQQQPPQKIKKKRNLPGNPDPDAEVIALSPKTLLATNRFVCEICNKGFQRDQNLQLHRRGHNLPWKLKQRNSKESRKRAYVCPEPTCVHHHPSRALGDLTGIKKHFCRKHGEKKWKCDKCSKIYAVQSDWKAHSKTCGTREYRCDCGTLFSRKDSFITHRAFCDALAEESARLSANKMGQSTADSTRQPFHLNLQNPPSLFPFTTTQQQQPLHISLNPWDQTQNPNPNFLQKLHNTVHIKPETLQLPIPPPVPAPVTSSPFLHKIQMVDAPFDSFQSAAATSAHLSATALLQKAATVGHVTSGMTQLVGAGAGVSPEYLGFAPGSLATWQKGDRLTRDFLGLTGDGGGVGDDGVETNMRVRSLLSFTGEIEFPPVAAAAYERDQTLLKAQGFGFAEPPASEAAWGNC